MIVKKNSFPYNPLSWKKKIIEGVSREWDNEESEHRIKFVLWRVG